MKSLLMLIPLLLLVASIGCNGPCKPCGEDAAGVAAVVGGEQITMGELNKAARDRLVRIDTEVYNVKMKVLESLIEEKLIAQAAKRKGVSIEQYMNEEVESKAGQPTPDEVEALYDARKGAISKPFEEVKDQISEYLRLNRQAQARAELLSKLGKESSIDVKLSPPRIEIDVGKLPAVGEDSARITLIEFSDYQCPFCKRARPTVWRIVDEYKDDIRYVFVDFPLAFHRDAKKAHEAARCAGDQGKYYEFNRKVFENQSKMGVDDLKKYAKQLNLNMDDFTSCLDSGKHAETVEMGMEKGAKAGVTGTPAFFINGIMLTGAMPYESFKEIIDTELKR